MSECQCMICVAHRPYHAKTCAVWSWRGSCSQRSFQCDCGFKARQDAQLVAKETSDPSPITTDKGPDRPAIEGPSLPSRDSLLDLRPSGISVAYTDNSGVLIECRPCNMMSTLLADVLKESQK